MPLLFSDSHVLYCWSVKNMKERLPLVAFTMGVMNCWRKPSFSSDGQKYWKKLITRPLMCEPSKS